MNTILKNFPPGPLDFYRRNASFDWKQLRILLDSEEGIKAEAIITKALKSLPEFNENPYHMSWEDKRRLANRQYNVLISNNMFNIDRISNKEKRAIYKIITSVAPAAVFKYAVSKLIMMYELETNGTGRHQVFIEELKKGNIHGCLCMTEIGHDSNMGALRTTATYDKNTKQFILHSPDFKAAKCWVDNLGQRATHAMVYAQMYTDNKHCGVQLFMVPVRDPKTLTPYPGLTIADMGEKIGLNGIDSGVLIFDKYRIPRKYLLNRAGDVTDDGKYVVANQNYNSNALSLANLSYARTEIVTVSLLYATRALVIAIRYAAVRKQFGLNSKDEIPIIEYKSHQMRLLPYLSFIYVTKTFTIFMHDMFGRNLSDLPNNIVSLDMALEVDAVSSAAKSTGSWIIRDAIQECREACGGHGYLTASGFGNLRNDHDANITNEGDNHILTQQTSNWLLKLWASVLSDKAISTPLSSANFLTNAMQILKQDRFSAASVKEICNPGHINKTYQWLICYLLQNTNEKYQHLIQEGVNKFDSNNQIHAMFARKLASAYVQCFSLHVFEEFIQKCADEHIQKVLWNIYSLYAMWNLEKFLSVLYEGGFALGEQLSNLTDEAISYLCEQLKDEAIALLDVLAPDDFVLNSVLGSSDGQAYLRLKSAIFGAPNALSRPTWWKEMLNKTYSVSSKF